MRWLLPFLLIASWAPAQDTLPLLERFVTPEEASADLVALEYWMLATHPAGLTSDSLILQGAIRRASNQLKAGASAWMFARVVGEAMATWGDSHTGLDWRKLLPEMEATWGRFPGQITLEGGRISVAQSRVIPTGTPIDSIGGWSARAVLENARGMLSSEGFVRQTHYRRAERLWPWVAAVPAPGSPSGVLVVRNDTVKWAVRATTETRSPKRRDVGISVDFTASPATLRIASFNRGDDDRYRRVLRRSLRRIRRRSPEGVVLDLRGNSGGSFSRMERLLQGFLLEPDPLMDRIEFRASEGAGKAFAPDFTLASPRTRARWAASDRWAAWRIEVDTLSPGTVWEGALRPIPPAKRPYRGTVAVLVDGGTASTAAHFVVWASNQERMRTFGEPALTGNSGTCAHAVSWTLPASELPVQCAAMRVWVNRTAGWNAGTWMPNEIAPRAEAEAAARNWLLSQ